MGEINILIVIFNKLLNESETMLSLQNCNGINNGNIHLHIWNNSPLSLHDDEKEWVKANFNNCKVSIYEDGINHYLSHVYNKIISLVSMDSLLILLDHDSMLPINFLEDIHNVVNDAKNANINLFLPVIMSHNDVVSPAYEKFFQHSYNISNQGIVDTNHLMAINSGMCIRTSYLKTQFPGYNEKLKFYATDNDFMLKYRNDNKYAYIFSSIIKHSLNFVEDDVNSKVRRFKAMKEGAIIIAKDKGALSVALEHLRFCFLVFKYSFKYRTLKFICNA